MNVIRWMMDFYDKKRNPIKYAKRIGVKIGNNCKLNGSPNWGSEPYLISLGDHTEVSFDCAFITHDGATWGFRNQERYKGVIRFGRIRVGDNVFIGARSVILPGVTIGDNSIIAAGAVVNKSIPANEIWRGVPAKYIMKVNDYAEKCLKESPPYNEDDMRSNRRDEILRVTKQL